ncbi:hypothetical protein [Ralstonia pseudosolanacearum]|uniref:hypothetical protein n=1 Tax=Ralstonia pseudosolanacearum TaxID=1310165 RepID=UPI0018D0EA2A|nr:hypothetical protein [Ralstonia pseudosolanacearum]
MKPLRLSAELLVRRLGWPGALLALLVGGAISVQLSLLPAERAKSTDLSHRITALKPRYYLRAPIIGALASQARHDCCPQSPMIRGVLSPGLVGGW